MKFVWIAGVLAVSASARAECFDAAARAKAEALIAKAPSIVEFCERCGDTAPGVPMKGLVRDRSREGLDYASLYVATSTHRYENVAALVGCPERGVSPTLRVDDATADGVLIVPDSAPVARAEPVEMVDPPAPAPDVAAALVPVPTVTVIDHRDAIPMWPYAVIAGGAGTLAAIGVLGLASRARRRRALQPRAVKLVARE